MTCCLILSIFLKACPPRFNNWHGRRCYYRRGALLQQSEDDGHWSGLIERCSVLMHGTVQMYPVEFGTVEELENVKAQYLCE